MQKMKKRITLPGTMILIGLALFSAKTNAQSGTLTTQLRKAFQSLR
jgi:hypothetical protein